MGAQCGCCEGVGVSGTGAIFGAAVRQMAVLERVAGKAPRAVARLRVYVFPGLPAWAKLCRSPTKESGCRRRTYGADCGCGGRVAVWMEKAGSKNSVARCAEYFGLLLRVAWGTGRNACATERRMRGEIHRRRPGTPVMLKGEDKELGRDLAEHLDICCWLAGAQAEAYAT